jgi:hypothetical protein
MVAPKGRFQSREGYVRSMAKVDARRVVQEDLELPFEPVNRAVHNDADHVVTPGARVATSPPAPPVPAVERPRAGWLRRLWRRLLALVTGRG